MKKKSLLITGALAISLLTAPTTSLASTDSESTSKAETHNAKVNHLINWLSQHEDAIRSGEIDFHSIFNKFKVDPKQAPTDNPPKETAPEQATPSTPAPETEQPKVEQPKQEETEQPKVEQPKQEETEQASSEVSAFEQQVVELTNDERTERGLEPLQLDPELSTVAQDKSLDMKNKGYFSHTSPTYGSPFEMMQAYGVDYRAAGENIAMGQTSPEQVVDAWMNSEGHRKNILNPNFTHIGVGHVENGNYWTQMFIGK